MADQKQKANRLESDVLSFVARCAAIIGRDAEDTASQDLHSECLDLGMESPIEQILYCAILTLAKINGIREADEPFKDENGEMHMIGLSVRPQVVIGKYRVDFLVSREILHYKSGCEKREIIVECDSQQFHERSEPERRYEKRRDRSLLSQGYKAFHYTGAEIVKEPFQIAAEILREMCGQTCTVEELLSELGR